MAGDVSGKDAVAEDSVIEVQVALLLVVGQLLTALSVFRGSISIITYAYEGAVGVLTGSMWLAEIKVFGTLIHILALPATFQLVAWSAKALVGAHGVHTLSSHTGSGEVALIHIFTAWPFLHSLEAHWTLAFKGSQRVHTYPVGTQRPIFTLIDIKTAARIWRRNKSIPTGAAEGTSHVLTPPMLADGLLRALIYIVTYSILGTEAWLAGDAFVTSRPVFTSPIRACPRVKALVDIFAQRLAGGLQAVAWMAIALVVSWEIDAGATVPTDIGLGTFINIHTGPYTLVNLQLVSPVAMAVVGAPCVHAHPLSSATWLCLAFIHIYAVPKLRMQAVPWVTMAIVGRRSRDAFSMAADVAVQFADVRLCHLCGSDFHGAPIPIFFLVFHHYCHRGLSNHLRVTGDEGGNVDRDVFHSLLLRGCHISW